MPRYVRPKGTRVSTHVDAAKLTEAVRGPRVAAQMGAVLLEIGARADETVPVGNDRHGVHLRDTQVREVQITPAGVVGLIGYTAWWAHFVHNGTVHVPANPWLLNAALSVLVTGRTTTARAA